MIFLKKMSKGRSTALKLRAASLVDPSHPHLQRTYFSSDMYSGYAETLHRWQHCHY